MSGVGCVQCSVSSVRYWVFGVQCSLPHWLNAQCSVLGKVFVFHRGKSHTRVLGGESALEVSVQTQRVGAYDVGTLKQTSGLHPPGLRHEKGPKGTHAINITGVNPGRESQAPLLRAVGHYSVFFIIQPRFYSPIFPLSDFETARQKERAITQGNAGPTSLRRVTRSETAK